MFPPVEVYWGLLLIISQGFHQDYFQSAKKERKENVLLNNSSYQQSKKAKPHIGQTGPKPKIPFPLPRGDASSSQVNSSFLLGWQ